MNDSYCPVTKAANSKGSEYDAYKISCSTFENKIEKSPNIISLGICHENEGEFEFDIPKAGRLHVVVQTKRMYAEFDLEDFLIECKKLCPHLF